MDNENINKLDNISIDIDIKSVVTSDDGWYTKKEVDVVCTSELAYVFVCLFGVYRPTRPGLSS